MKRTLITVLTLALAAVLGFSACGDDSGDIDPEAAPELCSKEFSCIVFILYVDISRKERDQEDHKARYKAEKAVACGKRSAQIPDRADLCP